MGNFKSKNDNLLNIYLIGKSIDLEGFIKSENSKYKSYKIITDFLKNEITEDNLKLLEKDIKEKFQINEQYNCILIFLDKIKIKEKISIIKSFLENMLKIYKPLIIIAIEEENISNNNYQGCQIGDDMNKQNVNNKYIEIVYYKKNDYFNIENKIKLIYNYYFNISDFILTKFCTMIKESKDTNDNIIYNDNIIKNQFNYNATFNILIMGRPGCGKSTLINLFLDEKRAREGIGYSITKLYSQYIHKNYPITFTDTPGFEDDEGIKKMRNFLENFYTFYREGRKKFHLVLYLINASNERTFMGIELDLIKYISEKLKIPIFFVCTHSRTEEYSLSFKEEIKINLIQNFQNTINLINNIYCCHLLNEKDGIYKRFGIDKLLNGIKVYFSKEIDLIERIVNNFSDFSETKNNLSILSSLEGSNSFSSYLLNLCENIIENYKSIIYELDEKSDKYDDLIEMLKYDLGFELNWDPKQITDDKWYSENHYKPKSCSIFGFKISKKDLVIDINGKSKTITEEKKINYLKKILKISEYIKLKVLISDNKDKINEYMKGAIENYKNAISNLDKINEIIKSKY